MSRGESSGGGQSSLGYLFGSGGKKPTDDPPTSPSKVVYPPYAIDKEDEIERPVLNPRPEKQDDSSNNYLGAPGHNSGKTITERPTTKVSSVPGGNSSLGYLFGDK